MKSSKQGKGISAIDRRWFLQAAGAAALPAALLAPGRTSAAGKPSRIVHANWGGDAERCYRSAARRFTEATGVALVSDGSGPAFGRVKQMVDAKRVVWDVIDNDFFYGIIASRAGLLAPIDYAIVDKAKVRNADKFALKDVVATYWYSNVIAYNKAKFANDPPKNWADFWDVKKYPGKRTCYKYCVSILEGALMADGVPMDKVYPMDIDRAIKKVKEIKDYLIPWQTGADSVDMFLHGDVVMGQVWHPRASVMEQQSNGQIVYTYNQGVLAPGGWFIPKYNPAGTEWASRWIAFNQSPQEEVDVLACFGMAPANDAAIKLETSADRKLDPALPEFAKSQLTIDSDFYAEHYFTFLQKFLDVLSS